MKRALICFTRPPVPGRTKTRLMPCLSGESCAALHTAFLRDIAAVCGRVDADLYVAFAPEGDWRVLEEIFPAALDMFPQTGEGLGERMHEALSRVLALGYEGCVLIGSDLPELTADHLTAAFAALEEADATLGPTADGGYYLVGLKKPCYALFAGQAYGCASVYENTLAAVRAAGLRFRPAPPCRDVDVPEDLRRLRGTVRPGSHTARLLNTLQWEENDP
jgi:rSAM/selenodomain-associated transferase 1